MFKNKEDGLKVTKEQIEQIFGQLIGLRPRQCDVEMVEQLGGTRIVLADFIWDHWLGEPDDLSVGGILDQMEDVWDTKAAPMFQRSTDLKCGKCGEEADEDLCVILGKRGWASHLCRGCADEVQAFLDK